MARRKKGFSWLALCLAAILCSFYSPVTAQANNIETVEIWVQIQPDGSAVFTEIWDIEMTNEANTEWYVAKYNLDQMAIKNLEVQEVLADGATIAFETLPTWDVNASRSQKAGKCGLVAANGGYEVCWGFGELGRHRYVVTYTLTGLVKSYEGGDAMSYNFLSSAAGGTDRLDIYIGVTGVTLEYPQTRVWVFGYEALSTFNEGMVQIKSQGRFSQGDYSAVLLVLEPGLIFPADIRDEPVDDIIELNMAGSIWEEEYNSGAETNTGGSWGAVPGGASFSPSRMFWWLVRPGMVLFIVFVLIIFGRRKPGNKKPAYNLPKEHKDVDYHRELPFGGDLCAAYARLDSLNRTNDGNIIGCFLLEWLRTGKVAMVKQEVGLIRKREEDALHLKDPGYEMPPMERSLYRKLVSAAGSGRILQNRQFEKWARQNYTEVEDWLSDYCGLGKTALEKMGAAETVPVTKFFGLFHTTKWQITPQGEEMTRKMFGFMKYLQDFTIIHEREAVEVQLWDQYLVFAQLFGIADQVAHQFKSLYPDIFTRPNDGSDMTDIIIATRISRSFGNSMYSGYRSGLSAASSSSGGGGGSSSSGGGGGASGGGGAGGR